MKRKILLVEDEPAIAENVVYALQSDGHLVEVVSTIADARARLGRLLEPGIMESRSVQSDENSAAFDLLIFDVGLPDGTGFDLIKELRQHSNIPVIFLTARGSEIDRVVGLEIGADDYITKPFSPRELAARVKSILRRTDGSTSSNPAQTGVEKPANESQSRPSPFVVDELRFQISFYGVAIELTRYEYRLLLVLVRAPGRVFSREQLMNRAWEEPDMSLERTIDAHIKSIRAKLRKVNAESDPIVTHRGFGYSLREML